MSFIATEATTVGEAVDEATRYMLNGLYAESATMRGKRDIEHNRTARHAIQQLADLLNEMYCADRDTLLSDVALPVVIK